MVQNVRLSICHFKDEKEVNSVLKDKNVLATQIHNDEVWIWWKDGPSEISDGSFNIVE